MSVDIEPLKGENRTLKNALGLALGFADEIIDGDPDAMGLTDHTIKTLAEEYRLIEPGWSSQMTRKTYVFLQALLTVQNEEERSDV